jgi:hypothetical protein
MGELPLYGMTNLAFGNCRASSPTPDDDHIIQARAARNPGQLQRREGYRQNTVVVSPRLFCILNGAASY